MVKIHFKALILLFFLIVLSSKLNAYTIEHFKNGDFDSGDLTGWTTDWPEYLWPKPTESGWNVVANYPSITNYFAHNHNENASIEQLFAPVLGSDIIDFSYQVYQRGPLPPAWQMLSMFTSIHILYSNSESVNVTPAGPLETWNTINLLPSIDVNKYIVGVRLWGTYRSDLDDITGIQTFVDNFTLTTEIPEPTTILLFGTGLAGLAAIRRRR